MSIINYMTYYSKINYKNCLIYFYLVVELWALLKSYEDMLWNFKNNIKDSFTDTFYSYLRPYNNFNENKLSWTEGKVDLELEKEIQKFLQNN